MGLGMGSFLFCGYVWLVLVENNCMSPLGRAMMLSKERRRGIPRSRWTLRRSHILDA